MNVDVEFNLQYSIPHVTSLDPNCIHPLFDSSRSLLDSLTIQIQEEGKSSLSSEVQLCIPYSGNNKLNTIYSTEIPLCCIPSNSFPILENQVKDSSTS